MNHLHPGAHGNHGGLRLLLEDRVYAQWAEDSRSQLNYILRTWVRHYNIERPHRGRDIGNNVLQVDFRPVRDGPIRRNRQLGGIVTSYTRDAA